MTDAVYFAVASVTIGGMGLLALALLGYSVFYPMAVLQVLAIIAVLIASSAALGALTILGWKGMNRW